MNDEPLVGFRRLGRSFQGQGFPGGGRAIVQAVRDVDLDILPGCTLGIVGESGCGKSTLGRMAVGLLEPDAGEVFIMGRPLYDRKAHTDYAAFRRGLAGAIQMIFQDPYSSLNPRMSIGQSVAEPLVCSRSGSGSASGIGENRASGFSAGPGGRLGRAAVRERVADMLEQVGLDADAARRYPHEFSGGQRQRAAIARALITSPAFVVCDEPTSSLDASIQSQVLNLLRDMQRDLSLTYMFISHDLAVVRHMSDRVAVMYRGLLVETGGSEEIFQAPCHPYTRLLLESVPGIGDIDGRDRSASGDSEPWGGRSASEGEVSAPARRGAEPDSAGPLDSDGCPFAPRCPYVVPVCRLAVPELAAADKPAPAMCGKRERGLRIGKEQGAPSGSRLVRCRLYKAL